MYCHLFFVKTCGLCQKLADYAEKVVNDNGFGKIFRD